MAPPIKRTTKPIIKLPNINPLDVEKPKVLNDIEPTIDDLPPKHIGMSSEEQEQAIDDVKNKKMLDKFIKEYEQFASIIDKEPKEMFSMYILSNLDKKLEMIKLVMGKKFNKSKVINFIIDEWMTKNYPLISSSDNYKNMLG